MADKQLAIALVGTDEASGVVGQSARKMAADLETLQKRTFDAGHDARAREVREMASHYDTLAAQYKAQHDRLIAYQQGAQQKLGTLRVQRAGLRATPEIVAQEREVHQVGALIARNEDVQAEAARAKKAEQDELARRYQVGAAERRAADLAAIERRIFDNTHSARERELRDVKMHADALRAQYKGDAEMHAKIAEAESRQVEEIDKRYQDNSQSRLQRFLVSGRALKTALGGIGIYVAYQLGKAGADYISGMAEETSARASGNAPEMLKGRLAGRAGIQGMYSWVPVLGGIAKDLHDSIADTKRETALAEHSERTNSEIAQLRQTIRAAAPGAERSRAGFLGYTPAEMARLAYEQGQQEHAARLRDAQEVAGHASGDAARARELHLGKAEQSAFALKEHEAERYVEQLRLVNAMEDEYARKNAQRAAQMEKLGFWRGIQESTISAQFTGPAGYERRQGIERQLQSLSHQAELTAPGFLGLDERIKALPQKEAWMKDYMARMRAQGNPGYTRYDAEKAWKREFGDVAELQQRRAAVVARQGAQTSALTEQQQYERMQWTTGLDVRKYMAEHGGPTQAQAREREVEAMRARHEEEMGGPKGSSTRLKEGTEEYIKLNAAQVAERSNMEAKFRREDEDCERRHLVVMRDAEAAAATDRETRRKREMDQIAEGYADELKKFKDDAVQKGRINDEIAAKQKALKVQQDEERRQERAGIIEQMLRTPGVGGQFSDTAARLALEEQQRRRRREHPEMSKDFDKMDPAERAELEAQLNWKPSEVASRRGAWDGGRPSGYDRFMPGQTPEAKALGAYLEKNYGALDQILKLLQNLAGNIGVAPTPG